MVKKKVSIDLLVSKVSLIFVMKTMIKPLKKLTKVLLDKTHKSQSPLKKRCKKRGDL
jgi:hypothetical protein